MVQSRQNGTARLARKSLNTATSAYPTAVNRAGFRNMFRTANLVCNGEAESYESLRLASGIGSSSSPQHLQTTKTTPSKSRSFTHKSRPSMSSFDSYEAPMNRKCLAQLQNHVILVNIPNDDIKKQLVLEKITIDIA